MANQSIHTKVKKYASSLFGRSVSIDSDSKEAKIQNRSFRKPFELSKLYPEIPNDITKLIIDGCVFENDFTIEEGNPNRNIIIKDNVIFKGDFHIEQGTFKGLEISGQSFGGNLVIKGGTFTEEVKIINVNVAKNLEIRGGEFQEKLYILDGKFNLIRIRQIDKNDYIDQLVIKGFIHHQVVISQSNIKKIMLKITVHKDNAVYIEGCEINSLKLLNLRNEGILSFNSISTGGGGETELIMRNSSLGKAYFNSFNFNGFSKIKIKGSNLSEIKMVNGHLPPDKISESSQGTGSNDRLSELYNQLYLAMQKQGNYTREMEYYEHYLRLRRKELWQENRNRWSGYISLLIHGFTSSFGRSWVKALILTLLFGFIFYLGFISSLKIDNIDNGKPYPLSKSSWFMIIIDLPRFLRFHIGYLLYFIFPSHSVDFIVGTSPTPYSYIWSGLARVFTSLGIYQIVTAFRRYGRK